MNIEQTDPEEASRNITRKFLYLVCPVNTPRTGGGGVSWG